MALVNLPPTVTFTYEDETGSTSSTQLSIPAATTIADARTAADGLLAELAANTGCIITGYSIAFSTIETAPGVAAAGARVEEKGNLVFRTAAGKLTKVTVPGILPGVVLASGRLDEDAATLATLIASLTGGIWTDSNGSDLVALDSLYQSFRTSSRRQLPSDRKPDV